MRRGHFGKEGSSTARDDVFHVNRLWFHGLSDMDLIALREREKQTRDDAQDMCLCKSIHGS